MSFMLVSLNVGLTYIIKKVSYDGLNFQLNTDFKTIFYFTLNETS